MANSDECPFNLYDEIRKAELGAAISVPAEKLCATPLRKDSTNPSGGVKFDSGKPRPELFPPDAYLEVSKVLAFGAKKSGDRNWEKGLTYSRVYGALLRHLNAWFGGEDLDGETGLSHLTHATCNAIFLLSFVLRRTGEDDRPKERTGTEG